MIASLCRRFGAQVLLSFVCATATHAQGRYDVEAFEPAPQVEGSVLNLYGGRSLAPGGFSLSLFGAYAKKPLAIETPDGDTIGTFVEDVGSLQLLAAVGLFDRVDVGVGLALHRTGEGDDFDDRRLEAASNPATKVAFGDIRITPRVSLLRHDGPSGVDLALVVPIWIPTGHDDSYAGEPFRIEPRIALDFHSERLVFVINAGYRVRSTARVVNTELDDQVTFGAGADLQVAGGFGLLGMVDSRLNVLAENFGDDAIDTELLFGARFAAGGFRAQLGAGPSVSQALTAPDYRLFAGLSYTHEPQPAAAPPPPQPAPDIDRDRDGVPEPQDRCPSDAEDADGFQDDDGCPDQDDDGDGIADAADSCPREPGVAEERGCPAKPTPAPAPAPEPAPAPVTAPPPAALELNEVVRFEKNRFAISSEHDATLDAIAQQLKDHPEAQLVSIEGHADDRGSAALNDRLAQGRAESVRNALIKRGVEKTRLRARGFGTSRPITSNDSEESRAQNRRVELRIERPTP